MRIDTCLTNWFQLSNGHRRSRSTSWRICTAGAIQPGVTTQLLEVVSRDAEAVKVMDALTVVQLEVRLISQQD